MSIENYISTKSTFGEYTRFAVDMLTCKGLATPPDLETICTLETLDFISSTFGSLRLHTRIAVIFGGGGGGGGRGGGGT